MSIAPKAFAVYVFGAAILVSACGPRAAAKTGGQTSAGTPQSPRVARHLTVAGNQPVTLVGEYKQGTKLDLEPKGGQWSAGPGAPMVGPEGNGGSLCLGDGAHHCIGGDAQAPLMGLIVLMTSCPIEQQGCFVFGRDPIGYPMTFTVPKDGFVYLAPNDWMEAVGDNVGALQVDVTP